MVRIKRAFDSPSEDDGFRILVDRLWPRGMTKEKADIDLWMRDVAPSTGLRKWYHHDQRKWDQFYRKYDRELGHKPNLLDKIEEYERECGTVTLVFSAKDEEHNNAVVLHDKVRLWEEHHPLETGE